MKPSLTTLGVTFSCLCAWQTVCAQKPVDAPLAFVGNQPWSAPQVWGTIPHPKPLPYGYTWNDYRGADIEHPLYAPRHAHGGTRPLSGPNVFGAMCCWFDKLFHSHKSIPAACDACQAAAVPLPPVPALPTAAPAVDDYAAEPAPLPPAAVEPPMVTPPAAPQPRVVTPRPLAAPLVEAEPPSLIEPVPLTPPTENLVRDPQPIAPAPIIAPQPVATPKPATTPQPVVTPTPIVTPKPLVAVPAEAPALTTPAPTVDASSSEERQLPVARPPVVELAPEFPMPTEPAVSPAPPRNQIPVPSQSVPRNVIPPAKRAK